MESTEFKCGQLISSGSCRYVKSIRTPASDVSQRSLVCAIWCVGVLGAAVGKVCVLFESIDLATGCAGSFTPACASGPLL